MDDRDGAVQERRHQEEEAAWAERAARRHQENDASDEWQRQQDEEHERQQREADDDWDEWQRQQDDDWDEWQRQQDDEYYEWLHGTTSPSAPRVGWSHFRRRGVDRHPPVRPGRDRHRADRALPRIPAKLHRSHLRAWAILPRGAARWSASSRRRVASARAWLAAAFGLPVPRHAPQVMEPTLFDARRQAG